MSIEQAIQSKFERFKAFLDERTKRLWTANEALELGRGGISILAKATGMSPNTIKKGISELKELGSSSDISNIRKPGGGRKKATENQPQLKIELEKLVDPLTRGDPSSALRWTCKSLRNLADELQSQGYTASTWLVRDLLLDMGYSLKTNKKILEGKDHPLRNEQFEYINLKAQEMLEQNNPVFSVDTKKKEILGNFANKGKEYEPQGINTKVKSHDFPDPSLDRANPFGIYDLATNCGFINVGVDHDTAAFAVASIKCWWYEVGYELYKNCNELLITADSGGSNSSRSRLWKWEISQLSNEICKPISVCHFPPGTSKWNKIEHRLFSFITLNWRGRPLLDYETIISLIRSTKTANGLSVKCCLDKNAYETGLKIGNEQFEKIKICSNEFQGNWNYTILPGTNHDLKPSS
jgi:transposase